MEYFIINRHGDILPSKYTGNQCKTPRHTHYYYSISIVMSTRLDENGFLFDHNHLHEAISKLALSGSCEEMQIQIHEAITKVVDMRSLFAYKCTIKPSLEAPINGAYLDRVFIKHERYLKLLTLLP